MPPYSTPTFMDILVEAFRQTGAEKVLRRGDILLQEGAVEKHLYFVATVSQ